MLHHILYALQPELQNQVATFLELVKWDANTKVIALHMRTGNPAGSTTNPQHLRMAEKEMSQLGRRSSDTYRAMDDNWKNRTMFISHLRSALAVHLAECEKIASELGYGTNYRVFVASDSQLVSDVLQTLPDYKTGKVFDRKQQFYHTGHPMLPKNLNMDNGGKGCQMWWFENPVIDSRLMASADALVLTRRSGFYLMAMAGAFQENRTVCFGKNTAQHFTGKALPNEVSHACWSRLGTAGEWDITHVGSSTKPEHSSIYCNCTRDTEVK